MVNRSTMGILVQTTGFMFKVCQGINTKTTKIPFHGIGHDARILHNRTRKTGCFCHTFHQVSSKAQPFGHESSIEYACIWDVKKSSR